MKTRIKNKYSENFLNNQNYIIWTTEKKKLLSKFFVEKNYKITLNFINNVLTYLESWYLFILIWILYLYVSTLFWYFPTKYFFYILWSLLFIIIWFFTTWHYKRVNNVNRFRDFLYLKNFSLFNFSLLLIIIFSFLHLIWFIWVDSSFITNSIVVLWFWTLIVLASWYKKHLNIFNLIFSPFILIVVLLSWLFSYIKTFFSKMKKIIKYTPNANLTKWIYDILDEKAFEKVENEFYKIELK